MKKNQKINSDSYRKNRQIHFSSHKTFALPPEKLGFHTVLAKPAALILTYALILMQGDKTILLHYINFQLCCKNYYSRHGETQFFSFCAESNYDKISATVKVLPPTNIKSFTLACFFAFSKASGTVL